MSKFDDLKARLSELELYQIQVLAENAVNAQLAIWESLFKIEKIVEQDCDTLGDWVQTIAVDTNAEPGYFESTPELTDQILQEFANAG